MWPNINIVASQYPMKALWIAWERHRRTTELARALKVVKLFQLELDAHRLIRYPYLLLRTLLIILKERPRLVIVQNPSVVLTLFVLFLLRPLVGRIIVDAHNEGITPFASKHAWLMPIYDMMQKRADLTIVTNEALAEIVGSNAGRPFVLEDRIPEFGKPLHTQLAGKHNAVLICTFERDEPYREVIKAAGLIDPGICIYVTGRPQKAPKKVIAQAPRNVVFTGFLAEQDYLNLLYSVDLIIDLTLMENCLVCGAYEAVALGKPMVLTDSDALRTYFHKGAIFTENHPHSIARAVYQVIENKETMKREVSDLKKELTLTWSFKLNQLTMTMIRMLSTKPMNR